MQPDEERLLLNRVPAGDESAFEALYRLYAERIRLAAWRISRRPDVAEDLANETWCRAYRARSNYDPARPFAAWVGGILQNVWREHARTSAADPINRSAPAEEADIDSHGAPPTHEQAIAEAEVLVALNACVDSLETEQRDLIRYRFFENQSLRAVAQRLGISEATVREVRLPAAIQRLERCLRSKGVPVEILKISSAQPPPGDQEPLGE